MKSSKKPSFRKEFNFMSCSTYLVQALCGIFKASICVVLELQALNFSFVVKYAVKERPGRAELGRVVSSRAGSLRVLLGRIGLDRVGLCRVVSSRVDSGRVATGRDGLDRV